MGHRYDSPAQLCDPASPYKSSGWTWATDMAVPHSSVILPVLTSHLDGHGPQIWQSRTAL